MKQKNIGKKLFISVVLMVLVQAGAGGKTAFAADGSGTNTVNPTSAAVSSTGNTFTFTFTAAETMDSGEIKLSTPSGWSAIQSVSGTAGYTTASSTGMIADVINNADSINNWNAGRDCGSVVQSTLIFHEGAASVECAAISQKAGNALQYYTLNSALDWSSYTKVGFWIYSTAAVASGDFAFGISSKSNFGSIQIANINTAIPANTWTYITLDISGLTRSSILSYGLQQVTNDVAINNANVFLDDILAGSGRPTFSGGAIDVRLLSLANAQTVTFTYGSGGGASGVTAPSTAGTSVATTTDRVSDAGNLTNISSQPTLTATSANNPVPSTTSISPTSTTAGASQFTLTVNGSNFISSSTVDWNGSARTTTYVSATQLTATIPASDVVSAGTASVTVVNPAPGGGTSNSETFTINSATSSPSPSPSPATPSVTNFSGSSRSNATFSGWAYPKSSIAVFEKSTVSGQYESVPFVRSDISSDGKFTITLQNFLQAGYFFALQAADADGRKTNIIPFSQFIPGGTNMIVNNIIFPPTSDIQPQAMAQGETAYVIGYAAPGSKVEIRVDDVPVGKITADENGYYKFSLAADSLKTGIHSLKTRQTTVDGDVSYFSVVKIFSVSPFSHPLADFNGDGVIDIRDWSTFLYRWNSKDADIKKLADLNGDGKVDISDFSIFLKEFNSQSK